MATAKPTVPNAWQFALLLVGLGVVWGFLPPRYSWLLGAILVFGAVAIANQAAAKEGKQGPVEELLKTLGL